MLSLILALILALISGWTVRDCSLLLWPDLNPDSMRRQKLTPLKRAIPLPLGLEAGFWVAACI